MIYYDTDCVDSLFQMPVQRLLTTSCRNFHKLQIIRPGTHQGCYFGKVISGK